MLTGAIALIGGAAEPTKEIMPVCIAGGGFESPSTCRCWLPVLWTVLIMMLIFYLYLKVMKREIKPPPAEEVPDPAVARALWAANVVERSKSSQSQCTYRRKLKKPQFEYLPEWLQR